MWGTAHSGMAEETPYEGEQAFRLAGDRLGKFVIIDELGRGSMGVVYEAFQTDLKRKVALKVLPANIALDAKQVRRFRREAESMARLRHDHVIHIYEVGAEADTHYFAMEMIVGHSYGEHGGRDRESVRGSARLAMQAARGLAHAHDHGVIHRDIKPGNLLVDRAERLVVTDFGLARLMDSGSLTSTDAIVGTPKYMSPEQILPGTKPMDGRTDVYSLGATLYEVVAGRAPFDEPSVQAFIKAILEQRPSSPRKFNRHVPHDLSTIILRCLEKEPDERYASAEAMANDLERFLDGDRIKAKPKGALRIGLETMRRHPGISAVSAVALIAIVLVLWFGREAAEATRAGRIDRRIIEIQALEDPEQAVREVVAILERHPKERRLHELHAQVRERLALKILEAPEPDFDRAFENVVLTGKTGGFWHVMLLFETHRAGDARRVATNLPEGSPLRRLAEARLALDAGEFEQAAEAKLLLDGVSAVHATYGLLTRAEAQLALARQAKAAGGDEADVGGRLDEALGHATAARDRAVELRQRWLRERVNLRRSDILLEKDPRLDVRTLIADSAAAFAEAFRDLTTLWGNMTRPEAAVARAYVNRVLEFAGMQSPPPDLEQKAEQRAKKAEKTRDPLSRIQANLLLAVARFPRRDFVRIKDALVAADEAEKTVSGQNPLAPYISWGYSFLYRQADDPGEAVTWAIAALEGAARTEDNFQDWEPLTRHALLLGEYAVRNKKRALAVQLYKLLTHAGFARLRKASWWNPGLTSRVAALAAG